MNKNLIWISFLVAFNFLNLNAQENLYFLVASPYESGYNDQFFSFLVKKEINSNDLKIQDTLSNEKFIVKNVKVYHYERFALIIKENMLTKEKWIVKIDFNNSVNVTERFFADKTLLTSLLESVLIKEGKDYIMVNYLLKNSNDLKDIQPVLKGLLIKNLEFVSVDFDDYSKAILTGEPGGCIEASDVLRYVNDGKDNLLRIPVTFDLNKRPIFEIHFPDTLKLKNSNKKEVYAIRANTEEMFVADYNTEAEINFTGKFITSRNVIIYNKRLNIWYRSSFKGNVTSFFPQGKWLTGIVAQHYTNNVSRLKWVSPGAEERVRDRNYTGGLVDFRFDMYGIYQPGILFLFDTENKTYIELNTGQGDSEILLIKNDEIYYRVNDKIFKRAILDGKKLGEEELVIQNSMVPDIHWCFLTS